MFAAIYIAGIGPSGHADLLRVAGGFAPAAETVEPGLVVCSIAGLRRLMGSAQTIAGEMARRAHAFGLDGSIGVARTRELAVLAARCRRGVSVVEPGRELDWLGGVALRVLPLAAETVALLELWGVETLAQFCALPVAGVHERLGRDAAFLHQLARGEWTRPLAVEAPAERFEQRVEVEDAVDNLEPLLFLLSGVLREFCERLNRQTLAVEHIDLRLELERSAAEDRRIDLAVPVRDPALLLRLIRAKLEARPAPAPVRAFTLRVEPVRPRFLQHDLYEPPRPEPGKLDWTLAKIRGLVGADRVGTPRLLNTHRPDAWALQPLPDLTQREAAAAARERWGLAFRFYRPPKPAQVQLRGEAPVFVAAGEVCGEIRECAGPWIKSGDWWAGEAWSRQEWDVALDSGGVFRIYKNVTVARWFVEGCYD